ncbi:MAG: hypothetical protein HY659_00030 [Rhizobiales bacterium]|nr:hypothetical protein [Hyphomicrobiales bacterium]
MQVLKIAVLAVGMTFIWAMLVALVYRFPVPFQGMESGFIGMVSAPIALLFYGVFYGGFLVPIALALLLYWIMTMKTFGLTSRARMWIATNIGAFVCVMLLATLDLIIGHPW